MTLLTVFMFILDVFFFADDALLFRVIGFDSDEHRLQTDLNSLASWSLRNNMIFNPVKTKVMHVTCSRNLHPPIYTMGNAPLDSTSSIQYLGITISSNFTWNSHINAIVSRANRLLGFICSVAGGASTKAFFTLNKSLVLPILEYGIPCWGAKMASQQQHLEHPKMTARSDVL